MRKLKKVKIRDITGGIKLVLTFFFGKLFKLFNNDIWLISERPNDARDNGYFLFKYIRENHPKMKVYYAINKSSPDFSKIESLGNYIDFSSLKHYVYYWAAKYNISSHIGTGEPSDRVCLNFEKIGIIKNKKVFLQHGVIKDILPFALYKNCKVDLFICGAKPEYDYVVKEYGYKYDSVKYLGLCRFDNLYNIESRKKQILIMPTWRSWINTSGDPSEFLQENYFLTYNSLLSNERLLKFIEEEGITLIFYLHDNFQKYTPFFKSISKNIIIASKDQYDVQELLKKSSLLVTDYSSVFFDFCYMGKSILYYQFDKEEYRKNHYKEGYFNYERDGFGEVIAQEDKLIDNLISLHRENYKLDELYNERIENFFELRDANNCERTFKAILKLGDK